MVVRITPTDEKTRVAVSQDVYHIFGAARHDVEFLKMLRTEVLQAANRLGTFGKPDNGNPVTIEMFSERAIREIARRGFISLKVDSSPRLSTRGLAIA